MSQLAPRFSSNRMVREYTEQCYLPGADNYRRRAADKGALAARIEQWHDSLRHHWSEVRFGNLYAQEEDARYVMRVQVYLGRLDPGLVSVELYADALDHNAEAVRIAMEKGEPVAGAVNGWIYQAAVKKDRPADHYTPRVMPHHTEALVPLEAQEILWRR